MSLFNTQRKKAGNATAGEDKAKKTKAVAVVKPAKEDKKEAKAKKESKDEKRAAAAAGVVFDKKSVIIKPRVTEKAGILSQSGVYTFDVKVGANVRQIADAIEAAYKVTPVKVSTAAVKGKAMFARGRKGSTSAGKKAYVYLEKGQTIEFI
ncbi:MAG TPA: 50S ribosomal protein L23 [Candidatus Paceibacterota bacterium]|nr:50S ribosomal protein L23 [Candidatus Paceibacterota bacterium]